MKRLKLFLLTLPFYSSAIAQPLSNQSETIPLNNVCVSFIGDASLLAVKYERLQKVGDKVLFTFGGGLGYNKQVKFCFFEPHCPPEVNFLTLPHNMTIGFGQKQHFLETGLGGTFLAGQGKGQDSFGRKVSTTVTDYLLYPIIGYRFHPLQSGKLNFRLYAQPIIRNSKTGWFSEKSGAVVIPFGASVGLSF